MLFNSLNYLVFFGTVAGLYFTLPHRFRTVLLLLASYGFYMAWEPGYVVLIWISTAVDYVAGRIMGASARTRVRRAALGASLAANLGLLFTFKYYGFFRDTLESVGLQGVLPASDLLLPVGISFYTFQTMSYAIDVYSGRMPPERNVLRFALFVAFFPQLVAGPIERARRLIPQLADRHGFDYARVADGLKLMLWGLFKKTVIADRLAEGVDHVYAAPGGHDGVTLAIATVFFAFQIYCDFSGYTDMALGAARILGIRLMDNFNRPYFATSIADFWRRWHISLSTWFRDYVYLPLGGNRTGPLRWRFNLAVVFLVSGLWHGANWNFAVWGGLHAGYMILGQLTAPWRERAANASGLARAPRLRRCLQIITTFALVNFAWIFFRAETLAGAAAILRGLPTGWGRCLLEPGAFLAALDALGMPRGELALGIALIAFLAAVQAAQSRGPIRERLMACPRPLRWCVYSLGLWSIFVLGVFRQKEFIYFVF